jgi:predicted Zn finger-like uncharacterized protein
LVIRCERCSTLYELDEALLSPSGSQVQCTKCDHVFTAFPAKTPGGTEVGVPAAQEARPPEPAPAAAPPQPAPAATPSAVPLPPAAAPAPPAERRAEGPRAKWGTSAPVYRPPSSPSGSAAAGGSPRAPLLKRDTVGVFEARLRWSARLRWLVPAAAVALLAVVVAAWLLLSRRAPPDDPRARREAMALAARDDLASLDEAASRLEALRRARGSKAAAADAAAVDVLRAAVVAEEGEALAARRTARAAERERLRREQPAGWEEGERAAAADVQALDQEVRTREERSRALAAAALDALRPLQRAGGALPEVGRGLGLYHALGGDRPSVERVAGAARAGAARDPWLDLAEGWVDARQADRAAWERAIVALGAVAAAHPELVRARYLLARAQAALGHRAEALSSVEGALSVNARHEGAQRLRAELAVPAEPPATPLSAPAEPPSGSPAGRSPAQPRKVFSQPPAGAPAQQAAPAPEPAGDATLAPPSWPSSSPAEGATTAPSPGLSTPAGAGGGESAGGAQPPPRRPREPEPEPAADGG